MRRKYGLFPSLLLQVDSWLRDHKGQTRGLEKLLCGHSNLGTDQGKLRQMGKAFLCRQSHKSVEVRKCVGIKGTPERARGESVIEALATRGLLGTSSTLSFALPL